MSSCSVCRHARRAEIDGKLLLGEPVRDLARIFSLAKTSLHRHLQNHLKVEAQASSLIRQATTGNVITERMERLYSSSQAVLARAEKSGDDGMALRALKEARSTLELVARLLALAQAESRVREIKTAEPLNLDQLMVMAHGRDWYQKSHGPGVILNVVDDEQENRDFPPPPRDTFLDPEPEPEPAGQSGTRRPIPAGWARDVLDDAEREG